MQFTELMVLYTIPVYWNREPPHNALRNAEQLRDFLLYLLNPERPGLGALFTYQFSGQNEPVWLSNDPAITQWVHDTYEKIWQPLADSLQNQGASSNEVYIGYSNHKAELFLDRERLTACFQLAEIEVNIPENICVSLSVNWSHDEQWLWWTPQLRICNYWPYNPEYAPTRSLEASTPPLTQEEAAHVLYQKFWVDLNTAFWRLLGKYLEQNVVTLELTPEAVWAPVFFCAKPHPMPLTPEDFLTRKNLHTLEKLLRGVVGGQIQDLLSAEIAGALLEGNILTFRREVRYLSKEPKFLSLWQSKYLLVPWLPEVTLEWEREAERESCFVADQLTFCEFVDGGGRHMDIGKFMLKPVHSLQLLSERPAIALDIAGKLQRRVAFEISSNSKDVNKDAKKTAYEIVQQLHSSISRLGVALLPETDKILSKKEEWAYVHERVIRRAHHSLAVRPLAGINSLIESLNESRAHVEIKKQLENLARNAQTTQRNFRNAREALKDMLEQERRELRDREEQRRDREEDHQRVVGFILAALAAVGAFPLLIGQANWHELKGEIEKWPYPMTWLSSIYITPHPYLILFSMICATAFIIGVFVVLFWGGRKTEQRTEDEIELYKWGNKVNEIEHLIAIAHQHKDAEARQQHDIKVCKELIEVMRWSERKFSASNSLPDNDLEAIRSEVAAFIINTELITRLPIPKGMPKTLCLCRYYITSINNSAQTDEDYKKALLEYGLTTKEVNDIEQKANDYKKEKEWPRNFIKWVISDDFNQHRTVDSQKDDNLASSSD